MKTIYLATGPWVGHDKVASRLVLMMSPEKTVKAAVVRIQKFNCLIDCKTVQIDNGVGTHFTDYDRDYLAKAYRAFRDELANLPMEPLAPPEVANLAAAKEIMDEVQSIFGVK